MVGVTEKVRPSFLVLSFLLSSRLRFLLLTLSPSSPLHPVVDDGYGLGYSVHDSYLRWVITSQKHMRGKELKENIVWACGEVRGMMERAEIAKAAEASASAKL